MFSIGEFSKITGLTVKTIRFYHEKKILIPAHIEPGSGYRFFDDRNIETARVISKLRGLEFSVEEIKSILAQYDQDEDLLQLLQKRKQETEQRLRKQEKIIEKIEKVISQQREQKKVDNVSNTIEIRQLPAVLVGGIRMNGKYSEFGKAYSQLGSALGRYIAGPAMCLYYDGEFKEDDADFEPLFQIRKQVDAAGISVRQLPECQAVCLQHVGPYESLGNSYAKLFTYLRENNLSTVLPTREVFLKGPGMIFRGNPNKYVTEIQLVIE